MLLEGIEKSSYISFKKLCVFMCVCVHVAGGSSINFG